METYLLLFLVSLCPVVLSALIYLAERTNAARKIPYIARQVLIGIMFGALAIMGTEFGVKIDGAVINARDASPICAGLLFGAPAGIIAGVIGGVERWLAVFWGAGEYTRLACSISTILAGVFAAVLRKYMFDNNVSVGVIYTGLGLPNGALNPVKAASELLEKLKEEK